MPKIDFKPKIKIFPTLNKNTYLVNWYVDWQPFLDVSDVDFELQMDYNDKFDTQNLKTINSGFFRSVLSAGYLINFKKDLRKSEKIYIRLRLVNNDPIYFSNWSDPVVLEINSTVYDKALELFNKLADKNIYSKEMPDSTRIFQYFYILASLAYEFEFYNKILSWQRILHKSPLEFLSDLWGYFFQSDYSIVNILDFYWHIRNLLDAFLEYSGKVQGIKKVGKAYLPEEIEVVDVYTILGWILGEHYIRDPNYPFIEPTIILYSKNEKKAAYVNIYNSWNLEFNEEDLKNKIKLNKPVMARIFYKFFNFSRKQILLNINEDWNQGVINNLVVENNKLKFNSSENSIGTWERIFDCGEVLGWRDLNVVYQKDENVNIKFYISSSNDLDNWSDWEEVLNNSHPLITPLRYFLKIKIEISGTGKAEIEVFKFNFIKKQSLTPEYGFNEGYWGYEEINWGYEGII